MDMDKKIKIQQTIIGIIVGLSVLVGLWLWLGDRIVEGVRNFEGFNSGGSEEIEREYRFTAVAAGTNHSLALTDQGELYAWGQNNHGQIGDRSGRTQINPVMVMRDVVYIDANRNQSFGVTSDGRLWAWGNNGFGRLGDGTTQNRNAPFFIMDNVAAVSAGATHTLALTNDGDVWAWGENSHGQIGNGTTGESLFPVMVASGMSAVAAGVRSSYALTEDGILWAWGASGAIGDDNQSLYPIPSLTGDMVFSSIAAASTGLFATAVAVTPDGVLWTWGLSFDRSPGGRLIEGVVAEPERAMVGQGITMKSYHFGNGRNQFFIDNDDVLRGFGRSDEGFGMSDWAQLGRFGAFPDEIVHIADDIMTVALGESHAVAIDTEGKIWAWGINNQGQLGNGTTEDSHVPTPTFILETESD